jgi:hypothetical protein
MNGRLRGRVSFGNPTDEISDSFQQMPIRCQSRLEGFLFFAACPLVALLSGCDGRQFHARRGFAETVPEQNQKTKTLS